MTDETDPAQSRGNLDSGLVKIQTIQKSKMYRELLLTVWNIFLQQFIQYDHIVVKEIIYSHMLLCV